jgi:hypothetical protein
MKIAGFSFIKNAVINDYPIVEAITSILPICDEFVIAVGKSEDDTLNLIKNIGSSKIRIIETIWDESLKEGGKVFAAETNKAYQAISKDTDWAFYIQGDECVHEKYLPLIKKEMATSLSNKNIEGLLFKYLHFYGSYDFIASSRRWYRREVRIVKFDKGIHSYRDAQGFRKNGKKIKVKLIDAYIYHYGWVKPPNALNHKVRNFNKYYQTEEWIEENHPKQDNFDFGNADRLIRFEGIHPQVIKEKIKLMNWALPIDPTLASKKLSLRRRFLQWIEDKTGRRLFEYRNYQIVNK